VTSSIPPSPPSLAIRAVFVALVALVARVAPVALVALLSLAPFAARPARAGTAGGTPAPARACRPGDTAVVVDTTAHRLYLCARGEVEGAFVVALGANGVDKRRAGDNRTPLGSYPLEAPRASRFFHRFVPVAYPTAAQARAGYSGSAIGIHGPPRGFETAARRQALAETDWTAGCIAVTTDEEIERIVAWLSQRRVRSVHLVR
jgi:hypothetical protein